MERGDGELWGITWVGRPEHRPQLKIVYCKPNQKLYLITNMAEMCHTKQMAFSTSISRTCPQDHCLVGVHFAIFMAVTTE